MQWSSDSEVKWSFDCWSNDSDVRACHQLEKKSFFWSFHDQLCRKITYLAVLGRTFFSSYLAKIPRKIFFPLN